MTNRQAKAIIEQNKENTAYYNGYIGDGLFRSDRENHYKDMKKAKSYYNYLKREINKGNI